MTTDVIDSINEPPTPKFAPGGYINPNPVSLRRGLLERAANSVDGDRDMEYGGPEDSFNTIATIWNAMMGHEYTATDVAMMMAGLKLARLANTRGEHEDSWVDLAGYAACGYEVQVRSKA